MKIVSINLGNFGSTGKIVKEIHELAEERGHETFFAYPENPGNLPKDRNDIIICNLKQRRLFSYLSSATGFPGFFAYFNTKKFIKKLENINPDVIHIHNIHGNYIHPGVLFNYIKKNNIKTIWTLHDCWPFTAKCPHFVGHNCYKWETQCNNCPALKEYPQAYIDHTKYLFRKKYSWFTDVRNMTIVTPSMWLANYVKRSFLKDYQVFTINNGIDLNSFKITESDFKKKYSLENKKILLGVSYEWNSKKGIEEFIKLSNDLPDEYKVVLVGYISDYYDTKNILNIPPTTNKNELIEIYSSADLFINPTKEDTYPTVNMESLACGTPVITFNTGGSPEIVDKSCGDVVLSNTYEELYEKVIFTCKNNVFSSADCLNRAKSFDKKNNFLKYINIYEKE